MTVFGPLVSAWTVEQAILTQLQNPPASGASAARFVYYLAEYERQNGLEPKTLKQPPGPNSYRGGVDAFTFEAEWFPMLHVLVQPAHNVEKLDPYTYGQRYVVQIVATAGNNDEDVARMTAIAYATAAASSVVNGGSLGIGAVQTVITRMPDTTLLDPNDARQVVRSTVELETFIAPVATQAGPTTWQFDPYVGPGEWPEVLETDVTITADPLTEDLVP